MTDVSLEPGQAIDAVWSERARGLSPAQQDALLERADAIRNEPEGAASAYGCYRALQERLHLSRPADVERTIWLFEHMEVADPSLMLLARAAAETTACTELWFQGRLRVAQIEREQGHIRAAEKLLFVLLGDVAGQDERWEALVAANLSLCLRHLNREVEALVLCRRALAGFERLGDRRRAIRVRQVVQNILISFHDWRRYERERERLERDIPELAEAERRQVDMSDLMMRAQAAFERNAFDTALVHLDEVEARFSHRRTWALVTRAFVLAVMGRGSEALAVLGDDPAEHEYGPQYSIQNDTTRVLCALQSQAPDAVEKTATAFLDRLEAGTEPPGNRITMLLHVARELGRLGEHGALAKRAYDLAAAAIVERILEVDRFARERPTLIELSAEERSTLGELRIRLLARHEELMRAVGRLLLEARARGEPMPSEWYGSEGLLCVCAWCGRMKRGDDGWVPVGAFIPDDSTLQLTHDICPDCYHERAQNGNATKSS